MVNVYQYNIKPFDRFNLYSKSCFWALNTYFLKLQHGIIEEYEYECSEDALAAYIALATRKT